MDYYNSNIYEEFLEIDIMQENFKEADEFI